MIEPVTPTENMMYVTARIVGIDGTGNASQFGTGFFYHFPYPGDETRFVPVLVTNKHVIKGANKTIFIAHTVSNGGKKPDGKVSVSSNFAEWIPHPNADVDLCALPIGGFLSSAKPSAFYRHIDKSIIPSDEQLQDLSAVEDVLMVGYPNGLWDSENNYPLIRRGITASHPAVDFKVNGAATTVVDIACFPGSSGSPILLYSPTSSYDKKTNSNMLGQGRIYFLGVLFSGPTIETDGQIVIRNIPTASVPTAQISMMMNLGYIVKAKELAALGDAIVKKFVPTPAP
ncbi:MAG: trypsin-like peptidase domain-containing protein [Pseudolabrys sp.]|nr:trypsin-like peptidase domain-containing protein [Pseudolabrys sp.]